jgi:hypothetical protein
MDWNYLFAIPSLLVGLFAGFQGIYQKYDEDPYRAARTSPGILYLVTRGILPAGVYVALYASRLMPHPLWFWALVCGTAGTELILRTQIFIKEEQGPGGAPRDLMYGPFDLLRWYQNLFLEGIKRHLPAYRGEALKASIREILVDGISFPVMCQRITDNLYYYDSEPHIQKTITQYIDKYLAVYEAKVQAGQLTQAQDIALQYKLGYSIRLLDSVGERGLKLLLS